MNKETVQEHKKESEKIWTPEAIDTFWVSLQERVRQNILTVFAPTFERWRKSGIEGEAEIQERIDVMMERERSFVIAVLSRLQEAKSSERILLFDIDETIGTVEFQDNHTFITILRPSLLPLLAEISASDLHIGLLSSRSKEGIEQQLQDPQHLAALRQYIDPAYINSSREEKELDCPLDELGERLKKEFGGKDGVIDKNLIGRDSENDFPQLPGDQTKLSVLKKKREEWKNKTVIVVDDFMYPRYLDTKKGFYGVALKETDGAFYKP